MTNLSQQILQKAVVLPPEMQVEVLHFVEFLLLRVKNQPEGEGIEPVFTFLGKGNSNGAINQIADLRDFAYED